MSLLAVGTERIPVGTGSLSVSYILLSAWHFKTNYEFFNTTKNNFKKILIYLFTEFNSNNELTRQELLYIGR
jgi:hypothetical protein